eukprot:4147546-Alexandrium_andersonii.AAC.1
MQSRTEDCIALYPLGNDQGSMKCFNLETKTIVVRDQFRILPMPDSVIQFMQEYAMTTNRPKTPSWRGGVDPKHLKFAMTTKHHYINHPLIQIREVPEAS